MSASASEKQQANAAAGVAAPTLTPTPKPTSVPTPAPAPTLITVPPVTNEPPAQMPPRTAPRPSVYDPNPSGNANYYPPSANVPTPRPQDQVIFSGTIQVPNLQPIYYQFNVPEGHPATLSGSFT